MAEIGREDGEIKTALAQRIAIMRVLCEHLIEMREYRVRRW